MKIYKITELINECLGELPKEMIDKHDIAWLEDITGIWLQKKEFFLDNGQIKNAKYFKDIVRSEEWVQKI